MKRIIAGTVLTLGLVTSLLFANYTTDEDMVPEYEQLQVVYDSCLDQMHGEKFCVLFTLSYANMVIGQGEITDEAFAFINEKYSLVWGEDSRDDFTASIFHLLYTYLVNEVVGDHDEAMYACVNAAKVFAIYRSALHDYYMKDDDIENWAEVACESGVSMFNLSMTGIPVTDTRMYEKLAQWR